MGIDGDTDQRVMTIAIKKLPGEGKAIFQLAVAGRGKIVQHLADPGTHAAFLGSPGNIAGTALMAPVAMAIATRVGIPAFLMTLIVVGAANGAALSPFAPTGIISNGLIAKMAGGLGIAPDALNGLAWKIHFNSEVAQAFANIGGFFVLGGWAWISQQKGGTLNLDELAPKPEPFNKHQILTLAMVGLLILMVILPGLGPLKPFFKANAWLANMLSNVGTIAFVLSCVLMLTGSGDSKAAVKVVPWGVIMMVCGVTVLIEVMDKAGGLNALVSLMATVSNPVTINGTLGFVTGLLSAYSSSSGVVMPMFLFAGTFFPLSVMPLSLQWIGWISPMWHGTQLARMASYGLSEPPWLVAVHLVVLVVFFVGGLWAASRTFTRRLVR